MSTKRILLTILATSAMLLAVGVGPGLPTPFTPLPVEGRPVTIPYAGRLTGDTGQPGG